MHLDDFNPSPLTPSQPSGSELLSHIFDDDPDVFPPHEFSSDAWLALLRDLGLRSKVYTPCTTTTTTTTTTAITATATATATARWTRRRS